MPRPSGRRLLLAAVAVTVLVLTFAVVLPRVANYGAVWREIHHLSAGWLLVIAAAAVLNLATYAPNWMVALPGLSYRKSIEVTTAGTAVANIAPLGGAVSVSLQYTMFRQWGFETVPTSRAIVLTGVWNNLVNLSLPAVALGLLTVKGGRNAALEAAAKAGAVLFLVFLAAFLLVIGSEDGARRVGRIVDRVRSRLRRIRRRPAAQGGPDIIARFRTDSVDLVKRRGLALTLATYVGVLTVFTVLVVCARAVGLTREEITFTEAFAAWSITRLLSAIPITPGGLGLIEIGLTGALTAFGGPESEVVAAVLLYRLVTFLPPIILGALVAFTWKRQHRLSTPEVVAPSPLLE